MTMSLSRTATKRAIREFVNERKAAGDSAVVIADAVKQTWPEWTITTRGVHRMGWECKIAWDRPTPKAHTARGSTCVHVWLEGGQLHTCGAPGYPRCANHTKQTAPAGSKFMIANRYL